METDNVDTFKSLLELYVNLRLVCSLIMYIILVIEVCTLYSSNNNNKYSHNTKHSTHKAVGKAGKQLLSQKTGEDGESLTKKLNTQDWYCRELCSPWHPGAIHPYFVCYSGKMFLVQGYKCTGIGLNTYL